MKDYYQILGVNQKASDDEIKKAFRKLARQHHPDANPGNKAAEARFKEISEANEILSDPQKRQQYDMLRQNPYAGGFGRQSGHGPGGFGGQGGAAGFGGLDDILNTIFRQSAGGGHAARAKGEAIEVEAEVTLEDVLAGTQVMVTVPRPGAGARKLKVPIPAGVATGTKVRVAGEGEPGSGGGPAGDLFVRVVVKPHARFTREGDDLLLDLPLSVFDAVLWAEVTVPTLEGEVKLKIPPGTQGGKVFRLKNKGLPHLKGAERGALRVRLILQIPEAIPEADLALWRTLAKKEPARH